MRTLVAVFATAVLLLLVFAYQSPRVQELFRSSPRVRRVPVAEPRPTVKEPEKPAAAVNSATQPKPKAVAKRDHPPERSAQAAVAGPPKLAKPSVPNDEVIQVLNGVFAARGWHGLALSVTDEIIEVSGEVASEEQRKKVLATLEKARETRRIDARGLTVAER